MFSQSTDPFLLGILGFLVDIPPLDVGFVAEPGLHSLCLLLSAKMRSESCRISQNLPPSIHAGSHKHLAMGNL